MRDDQKLHINTAILDTNKGSYSARPMELMVATLIHAFSLTFTDRPPPQVYRESHGRESWNDEIDVSRTIGWFSTISPLHLPTADGIDLVDAIDPMKNLVTDLPKNGWSYFTAKFIGESDAAANASDFPVEVLFNYVGSFHQLERDNSFLKALQIPENCDPMSYLGARRRTVFQILAEVERGCLAVTLEYP